MPSSTVTSASGFFTFGQVSTLAHSLRREIPVIRGRVWGGEEKNQGWAVECHSFEIFAQALKQMGDQVRFLAFDEMALDDDTLHVVHDDLQRLAVEENLSGDLISKALAALRSRENEIYAVVTYAFMSSGQVIFVRAQNALAPFVYHPHRLLSSEGISSVRKLKTLDN
jgi:hypothetical protein